MVSSLPANHWMCRSVLLYSTVSIVLYSIVSIIRVIVLNEELTSAIRGRRSCLTLGSRSGCSTRDGAEGRIKYALGIAVEVASKRQDATSSRAIGQLDQAQSHVAFKQEILVIAIALLELSDKYQIKNKSGKCINWTNDNNLLVY